MTRIRQFLCWRVLLAVFILAGACDSESDPVAPMEFVPVPTELRCDAAEVTLYVPTPVTLSASVLDQRGNALTDQTVSFISRDPTTATVDNTGLLTPLAAGETWVLATSASLRDSVAVTVRYHVLEGDAKGRVIGASDYIWSWDGFGLLFDGMLTDNDDYLAMILASESADSGLIVVAPEMPYVGEMNLPAMTPDEMFGADGVVDPTRTFAFFVEYADDEDVIYAPLPGGRLQVEAVEGTSGYGTSGRIEGRVVFRGVGYLETLEQNWEYQYQATGDTILVFADFNLLVQHLAFGEAVATLQGGEYPLTDAPLRGWWNQMDYYGQGYGELNVYPVNNDTYYPDIYLYTFAHGAGQTALDSVAPSMDYWGSDLYGSDFLKIYSGDDRGYSSGGTVTLTSVSQPVGDRWGEVRGTVQGDLTFWTMPQFTWTFLEAGTLSMEFAVPLWPDDGFWAAEQNDLENHPFGSRLFRQSSPASDREGG